MIFTAMAIGAGIGALAGIAVYGAKVLFSKTRKWSWKDAGAHALGGLVGGGVFPAVLAGLTAVGVPTAVGFVAAGGISWGGIWSLAQDAASWAFGRRKGLRKPKHYLINTAIGMATTALLLPVASRAVGPAGELVRHSGSLQSYVLPSRNVAANLIKSEGEFLAYGAISETIAATSAAVTRRVVTEGSAPAARAVGRSLPAGAPAITSELLFAEDPTEDAPPPEVRVAQDTTLPTNPWLAGLAQRVDSVEEEPEGDLTGLIDVLQPR